MNDHVDLDLLADREEGLVDAETTAAIDAHVTDCARCASLLADLQGVHEVLATQPGPTIPSDVQERIERAVEDERSAARPVVPLEQSRRRRTRTARVLLAAAAAAVVVGVGGTLLDEAGLGSAGRSESGSGAVTAREDAAEAPGPSDGPDRGPTTREGEGTPRAEGESPQAEVAPRVQRDPNLIEQVFVTRTVQPLRERATCVGAALDDVEWTGTSYAVEVDGQPGVVAFLGDPDNTAGEVEGVLVRCDADPEVVDRQRLRR